MGACGRHGEALELAGSHADADSWYVAQGVADLLIDAGRFDEAVTVLRSHLPASASRLAWLLASLGQVEDAIAVVQSRRASAGS